jgi:hypothetical protein
MSGAALSPPTTTRIKPAGSAGRVRRERWLGATGLVAAVAALPLPGHGHSPELAATLAIGALALLAGFRWGLAVLVVAEIFLVGAVWPLAILAKPPSVAAQIAVLISCCGAIPGVLSLRTGAAEVVGLCGLRRNRQGIAVARTALVATSVLVWSLPFLPG